MNLSHHLKEFVRVLMHSATLVDQHVEKKTFPEAF